MKKPTKEAASDAARALSAMRRTHGGGRPPKPAKCPRCGVECGGTRLAREHCRRMK